MPVTPSGKICAIPTRNPAEDNMMNFQHVAPNLIRFNWEDHFGLILKGDKEAIVFDPINARCASSVREYLHDIHNVVPRYIVYSHDHPDHISGGEIFKDEAIAISHANAKHIIVEDKIPTLIPAITFTDRLSIQLGSEAVDLLYCGPNSSYSTIFPYFRSAKALFAVDAVSIKRLPYRNLQYFFVNEWLSTMQELINLDIDLVIPGHGNIGTKADLVDHYNYAKHLYEHTLSGVRQGLTPQEIAATFDTLSISHWEKFDRWFFDNVAGMFNYVVNMRYYHKSHKI
jgi:glyoxylase-like metal-dependent hydrolase (beta-lactamase superfamily II)